MVESLHSMHVKDFETLIKMGNRILEKIKKNSDTKFFEKIHEKIKEYNTYHSESGAYVAYYNHAFEMFGPKLGQALQDACDRNDAGGLALRYIETFDIIASTYRDNYNNYI